MARFDCRCVEDARRAESFDLVNGALARAKKLAEIRVCEPMGERGSHGGHQHERGCQGREGKAKRTGFH